MTRFILLRFREQNAVALVRDSDGMILGEATGATCVWGEDPREAKQRMFIDHGSAIRYLKEWVAPLYGTNPKFEERDGESRIVSPNMPIGRTQ